MFNYDPIKDKQMSFVSNGGKFKLYTVLSGLIFPTPTQLRISFQKKYLQIVQDVSKVVEAPGSSPLDCLAVKISM
jgi:hypothetical protein